MNDPHWQKQGKKIDSKRLGVIALFVIFLTACGSEDVDEGPKGPGSCDVLNESSKSTVMSEIINSTPRASEGDPLYKKQWHLYQSNPSAGGDINVVPVWEQGIKGQGVVVAVVDDGLEINHEDLAANILPGKSMNYLSSIERAENDPTPLTGSGDYHGTAVAGILGARDYNGVGGRGVAPRVSLVGYNMLQKSSVLNAAHAMLNNKELVSVSNNSWSFAADDTGELVASNVLWRNAISAGVKSGNNGKGISYVFAAGNGGVNDVDNSNYDGYVNNRYVLAICSVGNYGKKAVYSEKGANLWLCAPSLGDAGVGITTTDLTSNEGLNPSSDHGNDYSNKNYTGRFGGTSSSAPLVSGVIALMLEKNPELGWRDVRMILARSAVKNDPTDAGWMVSPGSYPYNINHKYGFGVVDAAAAVSMAEGWSLLPDEKVFETAPSELNQLIPDGTGQVIDNITMSKDYTVEYVDVIVDIEHADIGDLTMTLTSPQGTKSILSETHDCQSECGVAVQCSSAFNRWSFGVARHLEESSLGEWQLSVVDEKSGTQGEIKYWQLKIYGQPKG